MFSFRPFCVAGAGLLAATILAGCVQSNAVRIDGAPAPLPPVDTAGVAVYPDLDALECSYERVAYIRTSSPVWGASRESVVRHARKKAGEVGANALIVRRLDEDGSSFFSPSGRNPRGQSLAVFEQRPCS